MSELVTELAGVRQGLNLFPTENRMSGAARAALALDFGGRYPGSEGDGFYYSDPQRIDRLYTACEDLTRRYFGVEHVFVRYLSGLHAMQSVLTSLCSPGDRVLVMDPDGGGHYATETICRDFGFEVGHVPLDKSTLLIDTAALAERVREFRPKVVYLDLSTSLRLPRVAELRAALGEEPLLCLDASHLLGLLPAGYDPAGLWAAVDICTASTHKTFPGPQKAVVLTGRQDVADAVAGSLPFRVSSGHTHSVAALAVTLDELMASRVAYGRLVVENARALAAGFAATGFDAAGAGFGFTETHQVWVAPGPADDPVGWGRRLAGAGIRGTVVNLPSHGRSGLRLGTQELTRTGMRPADMEIVARLVGEAVGGADPDVLRDKVNEFTAGFGDVHTSFAGPAIGSEER